MHMLIKNNDKNSIEQSIEIQIHHYHLLSNMCHTQEKKKTKQDVKAEKDHVYALSSFVCSPLFFMFIY